MDNGGRQTRGASLTAANNVPLFAFLLAHLCVLPVFTRGMALRLSRPLSRRASLLHTPPHRAHHLTRLFAPYAPLSRCCLSTLFSFLPARAAHLLHSLTCSFTSSLFPGQYLRSRHACLVLSHATASSALLFLSGGRSGQQRRQK